MPGGRPATATPRHRVAVENQIIRRREKENRHQQTWGGQVQYYKKFEKANNKFEEWTSPRYYETNNKLLEDMRTDRDKKELLEKRRDKLRKLLNEEEKSQQIEKMVITRNKYLSPRSRVDDVPTELLKELHLGNQQQEEDRRKHEAELGLYQQWRSNNPILKDYERMLKTRDLKLSWLDQQIEKRIQKEKEEDEYRKMLKERERCLEEEKQREEEITKEAELKEIEYREELEKQIEELKHKEKLSEKLKEEEVEQVRKQLLLAELEEKQKLEEKRRLNCECALYNIKQYTLKLKQKALDVEEDLRKEKELVEELLKCEAIELIENEKKKKELRETMKEFLNFAREQQDLEKQRQKYLGFIFDSEAKFMYEKQKEIWDNEQIARNNLLKDVLDCVRKQVDEKVEKNRERQKKILEEREENLRLIEEHHEEMRKAKEEAEGKRREWKEGIDKQLKEKFAVEKKLKSLEQKNIALELEKTRKEEERLRREIFKLQKREKPCLPRRSNIWF